MKVKQEDLIGELKGFPIEVVQKMVDCQVNQGNEADVSIFQEGNYLELDEGGFDWDLSEDGDYFWEQVIVLCNFETFFEKYPKIGSWKKPKLVEKTKKWWKNSWFEILYVMYLCSILIRVQFFDKVMTESLGMSAIIGLIIAIGILILKNNVEKS